MYFCTVNVNSRVMVCTLSSSLNDVGDDDYGVMRRRKRKVMTDDDENNNNADGFF